MVRELDVGRWTLDVGRWSDPGRGLVERGTSNVQLDRVAALGRDRCAALIAPAQEQAVLAARQARRRAQIQRFDDALATIPLRRRQVRVERGTLDARHDGAIR